MIVAVAMAGAGTAVTVLTAVVAAAPAVQLGFIRPRLSRKSDRVPAGEDLPRSRARHFYAAFEIVKVVALIALGSALLSALPG